MANELNKQIAKLLGYHIYHYDKDRAERCYYQLWDPNGNPVKGPFAGERKTEEEAWNDVPDWEGEAGLALGLWLKYPGITITSEEGGIRVGHTPSGLSELCTDTQCVAYTLALFFSRYVSPKKLENERKAKRIRDQIAALEDELHDLESEANDG